jgi:hypothetical protein
MDRLTCIESIVAEERVHTYKMSCQYVAAAECIVEYTSLVFTSRYTKLQETASVVNRNRCPKRLWFLELALFSVV